MYTIPKFFVKTAFLLISSLYISSCNQKKAAVQSIQVPQEESASVRKSADFPENVDFWSDFPDDELADELIRRMSDSEILAQIFMFGWAGAEPSPLLIQWVSERGLGSIKIFGWNTDDIHQVARSVTELQQRSQKRDLRIPLFVATDQEGGWIRHVKGEMSDTPGNLAIGASGRPEDAWKTGFYIARELRVLGINMNFAPAVDLYTNLKSTVIGPRSFGENPDFAGILGASYAAGTQAAGVIPTAKHYPGHGDTGLDSHGKLPIINIDYETFMTREMIPFKYLIKEHIPAIMSGHLSFPRVIGDDTPASLSKAFLTDILRDELGFDGLIITDDMMMNGATMYAGSLSSACRMAIEAGNDILLSSTTAQLNEPLWTANLSRMQTNAKFREQVKTAARRVIYHKLRYFKHSDAVPLYPDAEKIDQNIPDREGQAFFQDQAIRAISVFKRGKNFPLSRSDAQKKRVLLVGPLQNFIAAGKACYGENTPIFKFDDAPGPIHIDWMSRRLPGMAEGYDVVIALVDDKGSAEIISTLKPLANRVVIFSTMAPTFVSEIADWADTVLVGYSWSDFSVKALFSALAGDFEPSGVLPLSALSNK